MTQIDAKLASDRPCQAVMALTDSVPAALLVDLDGTLIRGGEVIDGAISFVARHRDRIVLVSNNSTDTPQTMVSKLTRLGLHIPQRRIFLAGFIAVNHLAAIHPGVRAMIVASPDIRAHAATRGLLLVDDTPDIVLIARDESFDYARLAVAANAVAGGAKFYVSNNDVAHPGAGRWRVPETGSLMLAVMAVSGRSPDRVFGKPDGHMLREALRTVHVCASRAVMIGDNPATDGLAAQDALVRFIEVGDRVGRTVANMSFDAGALL
jgi:HAD superfamily hydrolase (TIGR01450 family)